MDWQWIVVGIAVVVAAVYSGRAFLLQFFRSDDEPAACSSCPALKAVEDGRRTSK